MIQMRTIFKLNQSFSRYFTSQNNIAKNLASQILKHHDFTELQCSKALDPIETLLNNDSHEIIDKSLKCWKHNILPKNHHDHLSRYEDFKLVFCDKEPKLLLIDVDYLNNRVNQLMNLDLLRGRNDLWTVFKQSPVGFFLQDWNELLKKYYYITYKILPRFNPEIKTDQMHPLIRCPQAIEQTYSQIKTRFIFVQRTGFNVDDENVNLKTLLLTPEKDFLQIYAPNCTLEELKALEILNSSNLGKEDDELFENLVELSPKKHTTKTKSMNQSFMKNSIQEGILLSH